MSDMMKAFNEALEGLDAEFADAVVGQIADDQRAVDLIFDRLLELYIARASSRHLLALVSYRPRARNKTPLARPLTRLSG
jgi:hypothetical protein